MKAFILFSVFVSITGKVVDLDLKSLEAALKKAPKPILQAMVEREQNYLKESELSLKDCENLRRTPAPDKPDDPLWFTCMSIANFEGFQNGKSSLVWPVNDSTLRQLNYVWSDGLSKDLDDMLKNVPKEVLYQIMGRIQGYFYDTGCALRANTCRKLTGHKFDSLPKETNPDTTYYCNLHCVLFVNAEKMANGSKSLAWKIDDMTSVKLLAANILFEQFGLLVEI